MPAQPTLTLCTHRHAFCCEGSEFRVEIDAGLASMRSRLYRGPSLVAEDFTVAVGPRAELRNHLLRVPLSAGRWLKVETGHLGWARVGMAAWVGGELVHESHPGRELRFPRGVQQALEGGVARRAASGDSWFPPSGGSRGDYVLAMLLAVVVWAVVALA